MIEQIGKSLKFDVFYSASKVGKTGLTVTVDVYKNDSVIVSSASATPIGGGIYSYTLVNTSVDIAGYYIAIFKTTDTTVYLQQIPCLKIVGTSWVEKLNLPVANLSTMVDSDVWGYGNKTLSDFSVLISSVWSFATRELTSLGNTIVDIWSYVTRTPTDMGNLIVDIWNNPIRTLTSFGTLVSTIWLYAKRTLTSFGNYEIIEKRVIITDDISDKVDITNRIHDVADITDEKEIKVRR